MGIVLFCKQPLILMTAIFIFGIEIAIDSWRNWLYPSMNYERLELLLKDENWEEANLETSRLLLKLSRRNFIQLYYVFPRLYDFKNVPCGDLSIINKLWTKHSQNRFGLSIQSDIWHGPMKYINLPNNIDHSSEDYQEASIIFQEVVNSRRYLPENLSDRELGQLPSQNWIFEGTQDGQNPFGTARDFYSHFKTCKFQ